MIGAFPVERSKGSHASPASRRRHRAVDSIPSFHIRCPGIQLQTAFAPWAGWGRDCFPHEALSGAATRVRDCSWMCTDSGTRMATQATAGAKASCAYVAVAVSQPGGILTAPPSSVAVRRRSDPLHPGPISAGEQQEQSRDGWPSLQLPRDRKRNLACSKLVVTHLFSRQVVSRRWTSSEV